MLMGGLERLMGRGGCSVFCTALGYKLLLFFPRISYSFADSKCVLLLSFYKQFLCISEN